MQALFARADWQAFAGRALCTEHRPVALIVDPGQWDLLDAARRALPLPDDIRQQLPDVDPEHLDALLRPWFEQQAGTLMEWRLRRSMWVHGMPTLGHYVRDLGRYRVSDAVQNIRCATLVALAEGDPLAAASQRFHDALRGPKHLARFTETEGAAGHCEGWNRSRFDQVAFDWLDEHIALGG